MTGRHVIRLVARREFTERVRERSFMISTGITLAILVAVLVLPSLLGFGGPSQFTVAAGDAQGRALARQASTLADEFDIKLTVKDRPPADVTLEGGAIRAGKQPD